MNYVSRESEAFRAERFRKVLSIVVCPTCHKDLVTAPVGLGCLHCNKTYPVEDGTIYFIPSMPQADELDTVKNFLKRTLGNLYYKVGVNIIAPTFPFDYRKQIRKYLGQNAVVVDIGAGNHRIDPHVITLDGVGYEAVDIVADLRSLPFRSDSVDCIASRSVLEHIPDLSLLIPEIKRSIRNEGYSMHLIPFLFPYHASPDDYQRFTASGAAGLFSEWQLVDQYNATGPITLFLLWILELAATLLSFGSKRFKAVLYLGLCAVLFPIKYLDVFFVRRKAFIGLAPSIFTVVRKPNL